MTENSAQEARPSFLEAWKATRREELPLQDPVQSVLQIALSASFVASGAASIASGYSVRYAPGVLPLTKPRIVVGSLAVATNVCAVASKTLMLRSRLQLEGEEKRGFAARESLNLIGASAANAVVVALYGFEAVTGRNMGKRPLSVFGRAQSGLYALQASHVVVSAARELYARREELPTELQVTAILLKESMKAAKDDFLVKVGVKTNNKDFLDAAAANFQSLMKRQSVK